jgi:murein DD-endopeptidase MepM/ murein hydrolase activator NlpD
VTGGHQNRVFGKRATQHVIILASGDKVRHVTIRPWMTASAIGLFAVFAVGYLLATSYLVLRDDLIGATMARQARMQYDYEDRIAALRAQVDRVTSRQLLDQQVVEDKVERLMEQQEALTSRHSKLDALLSRAESSGVVDKDATTSSGAPARDHAALAGGPQAIETALSGGRPADAPPENSTLAYVPAPETVADRADRVFSKVTLSLKLIEQEQLNRIRHLTSGVSETADNISSIIKRVGVTLPEDTVGVEAGSAVGGPYVPPESEDAFNRSVDDLDTALTHLETVRGTAESLPFRSPAPGREITSPFGNRKDPFLGKLALHTGVDFGFNSGEKVTATAPGKVISAGWSGGYGNMVEIDHGNGISTRYGHMADILVKTGETVKTGDIIGLAGSTGRSTGTHLHYEVRVHGQAVDPLHFVRAGVKLASYIN